MFKSILPEPSHCSRAATIVVFLLREHIPKRWAVNGVFGKLGIIGFSGVTVDMLVQVANEDRELWNFCMN